MSAITIRPTSAKPAIAPARVDCTRCETPIEVAAQISPGPKLFQKVERPASDVVIFSPSFEKAARECASEP